MNLKRLQQHWDAWGKTDPYWAILAVPEKKGNRWDLDEFFAAGREEIDNVMASLRGLGQEPTFGRALDFGCGVGRLTQALADRFDEAWGVDIAPSMIKLANRYNRHADRCRYFLNDRPDLRVFQDSTFDFIYSNITLQHVDSSYHASYLAEFLRVLVPGGVLVFQLPSTLRGVGEPSGATGPGAATPAGMEPTPSAHQSESGVRARIRSRTPESILAFYRRARDRTGSLGRSAQHGLGRTGDLAANVIGKLQAAQRESVRLQGPIIEMWGTPRDEVVRLLEQHGGEIVSVEPDEWAPDWVGFRYVVLKSH
jgi:SAM-dependent methyltransferase